MRERSCSRTDEAKNASAVREQLLSRTVCLTLVRRGHGTSHEEGPSYEERRHEGDEGRHENKKVEQDRQGQEGKGPGVQWQQGEDGVRSSQGQLDQEQAREDRQQEGQRQRQEEVRGHQRLVRLRRSGAQGSEPQGLRGNQRQEGRGQGPLCEGQGSIRGTPVSSSCSQ